MWEMLKVSEYILVCIHFINEVNQLTFLLVSVPNIKKIYKCNENIGIGTQYRQVPKIKVSVSGEYWKKWYQCIPTEIQVYLSN